jgi:hypothetical protein
MMSGKAVLYIPTSLDGFIAGPNDDISWLSRYNDVDYGFEAFFSGVGAIIQGAEPTMSSCETAGRLHALFPPSS